jgi:hypothetical protein
MIHALNRCSSTPTLETRSYESYRPRSAESASIVVPQVIPDQFLGLVAVSVMARPDRLDPTPDLLVRLSGVAAQATAALKKGETGSPDHPSSRSTMTSPAAIAAREGLELWRGVGCACQQQPGFATSDQEHAADGCGSC